GLEVLAVGTYGAALEAAQSGALGEVPPAVAEYVTTAQAHHQAHLDAWNGVITGAGEAEVTEPPADLKATVDEQFAGVTDVAGAAELALLLEQTAADTYLAVIPTLEGTDAIKLASTIQPIDMQHAAVLRYVLGQYPVPNVFANTDNAYSG
ncbi:MAG: ferritin-like domain-containing protein, partial [Acidimicrobiia bacterium]|nr:ferritin-like domain-containing protein [Acidimicrobiia bacterium]